MPLPSKYSQKRDGGGKGREGKKREGGVEREGGGVKGRGIDTFKRRRYLLGVNWYYNILCFQFTPYTWRHLLKVSMPLLLKYPPKRNGEGREWERREEKGNGEGMEKGWRMGGGGMSGRALIPSKCGGI